MCATERILIYVFLRLILVRFLIAFSIFFCCRDILILARLAVYTRMDTLSSWIFRGRRPRLGF